MRRMALTAATLLAALLGLAGAGVASVDMLREEVVIDVTGTVEDGCEEPILLTSGRVVETIQQFEDGNGRTHFLWRFQTFGLQGVGVESGAIYTDKSHGVQTGIASIEEGFATGGFTVHVRISSKDRHVADLLFRQSFKIVKRDGVNRVFMDRITFSCG